MSVLPVLGASVQTVPFGDLDLDQNPSVVTNVTLDGLAMSSNTYTKAETDAKIVELAPAPGNYGVVSNAAMSAAASTNDFLRLTGGTMSGDLFSIVSDIGVRDSVGGFLALRADAAGAFFWYRNGFYGADSPIYRINLPDSAGTIALQSDIPPAVSNVVTKAYVESLGISSEEEDPNVPAWAKAATKPEYTAEEVGATTPEDVIAATNGLFKVDQARESDSYFYGTLWADEIYAVRFGFLFDALDCSYILPKATQGDEEIRLASETYVGRAIAEIDIPEVPSWALQPTKPAYTAAEIGAATPGDVSSAISNTVTPAYIRERMGVRLYVGEDGGIYVHAEEE